MKNNKLILALLLAVIVVGAAVLPPAVRTEAAHCTPAWSATVGRSLWGPVMDIFHNEAFVGTLVAYPQGDEGYFAYGRVYVVGEWRYYSVSASVDPSGSSCVTATPL